ncbi:MAG: antibiotic biosynthesis monooxygenase [Lachnospiraceae bacterium]|nr:antibiotic biosynthesis monooxygenase [Lachnospiraceae bacterium]
MLIVHVTYELKDGMRDTFLQKLAEFQIAEKSREEAGNYDYTYFLPIDGSNTIFLTEAWENLEAQAAHTQTAHFKELGALKDACVNRAVIRKFDGAVEV